MTYECMYSECALNDLRKQLREEKNYELLHKTRT
jgi:hypothetical protein